MKRYLLLLILALAACKTTDRLATCTGTPFQLNAGQWETTPEDLQVECAEEPK
ncbi:MULTISPECIES: type IV secretion system lipoprotein VirB7 [Mesorhizobium]|uniref:Type IV secretion system lipoprotein VirB7 n=2 Tax=Mesorhizobium TaxID=68287 RepID=E8TGH5_MESCW|nr:MULTISPECIES: type IV secretion system lipoprotein VirB7 [Mesorhizobium]TPJ38299.1 type IV secretion system lipoprotein VirB7 [Mesorhizobium sp. B2-6-6]ADV14688.1 type IV secretion system lipoprotein VirB7 [Mesorhizobium ciceri biovar biserrulae WSM1271]AEH90574.1 VirB7 family protein [Mesorhizobium opportunistum WSM2075]ARP67175.1 type IV secretion system protein VirB7 [Mesorhizobium sp. WSM1497]MCA0002752.1 type IV secretion system lipoprotein VirB7 [Mesorhizobium sp. B264B2A]